MTYHRNIVFLSVFLCNIVSVGYLFGTSRLLPAVIDSFRATRARASVIPSTFTAAFWCSGALSGTIVQRYGARRVGTAGSAIVGLSVCICYFAGSILYIVLSQGVFAAVGSSLLLLSGVSVVGKCFEGKALSLVLSLILAACGIGGMVYSYLLGYLVEMYGLNGTFLITGAILLNTFVLTKFWPLEQTANRPQKEQSAPMTTEGQEMNGPGDELLLKVSVKETIKQIFSVTSFVVFALGAAITMTSQTVVLIFAADLMKDKYLQPYLASLAVFMYNLSSIVGRLLPGLLNNIPHCSLLRVPLLGTGFGVIGGLLIAIKETELFSLMACCMAGLSFGIVAVSVPTTIVELVGSAHLPTGFGCYTTMCGVGTLLAGPINGYIRDITESYKTVFLSAAVASGVGGGFFLATLWMRRRQRFTRS